MSPTCLIVPLGEMAMNAIRSVTRVGLRMLSTTGVALLVLFGCPGDLSAVAIDEVVPADDPSADASFDRLFVGICFLFYRIQLYFFEC